MSVDGGDRDPEFRRIGLAQLRDVVGDRAGKVVAISGMGLFEKVEQRRFGGLVGADGGDRDGDIHGSGPISERRWLRPCKPDACGSILRMPRVAREAGRGVGLSGSFRPPDMLRSRVNSGRSHAYRSCLCHSGRHTFSERRGRIRADEIPASALAGYPVRRNPGRVARQLSGRPLQLHGGRAAGRAGGAAAARGRRQFHALAAAACRAVRPLPCDRLECAGLHDERRVREGRRRVQGLRRRGAGLPDRAEDFGAPSISSAIPSAAAWRNALPCIIPTGSRSLR